MENRVKYILIAFCVIITAGSIKTCINQPETIKDIVIDSTPPDMTVLKHIDKDIAHDAAIDIKKELKEKARSKISDLTNEQYFSVLDGSNPDFVQAIKSRMNDPESFEHIETAYNDRGPVLVIRMKFKGKNGFGGTITSSFVADLDKSTRQISNLRKLKL